MKKSDENPRTSRRICFVAAITNEGRLMRARLVSSSAWHFTPTSSKDYKRDYHKIVDSINYVHLFNNQLLPNIYKPASNFFENAYYHKSKLSDTPKVSKMQKTEALQELDRIGIEYHSNISAVEAKQKFGKWQVENVKTEILSLVEECGHIVIFTPPYYNDLQPIHYMKAKNKSYVGRFYYRGTNLSDVRARL